MEVKSRNKNLVVKVTNEVRLHEETGAHRTGKEYIQAIHHVSVRVGLGKSLISEPPKGFD
jgi:hypothetical protein